jgi:hypothetical protein
MLMMSLVLHGAVLMLPIPSDLDKPKPPKKQEQVKITQLPRTRSSPKLSPESSSKPNPQPTPEPSQSTRSNEATPPDFLPELTTQLSPQLSESIRLDELTLPESSGKPNPQPSPEPSESTPPEPKQQSANPIISQANPKQNPTSQPKPEESDSSNSKLSQSPPSNPAPNTETNADDPKANDPLKDFLNNFPFPDNANVGSLGVLSKEAEESARNVKQPLEGVIKYYGKELPVRKYSPLASPIEDDTDLKVYQVYKGSAYQYLHLISKEEDTIIFLSEKKLSRTDLANLEVETPQQREFKGILQETISVASASTKELTPDIKNKIASGKYTTLGIYPGKTPQQLGEEFKIALEKKKYQVKPPQDIDKAGILIWAKKDTFIGSIQLTPSEDGTGTAIIILDKLSP